MILLLALAQTAVVSTVFLAIGALAFAIVVVFAALAIVATVLFLPPILLALALSSTAREFFFGAILWPILSN